MKKTSLDNINLPLKIVISLSVYVFFFLFTQGLYDKAMAYIGENFLNSKTVIVGSTAIKVTIADSDLERIKGLSGSKNLDKQHGMLFVFDQEDFHGIWMKDMNYPIDIIWFDENKIVVDFALNIEPSTYPTVFKPLKKALYVLEVNAGFIEKNNLKIGDSIAI
jgi:uncharacterized membrane protein (UPF0127 family)